MGFLDYAAKTTMDKEKTFIENAFIILGMIASVAMGWWKIISPSFKFIKEWLKKKDWQNLQSGYSMKLY